MEIKTKFNIGDEVFFFNDYNQAKPRVAGYCRWNCYYH